MALTYINPYLGLTISDDYIWHSHISTHTLASPFQTTIYGTHIYQPIPWPHHFRRLYMALTYINPYLGLTISDDYIWHSHISTHTLASPFQTTIYGTHIYQPIPWPHHFRRLYIALTYINSHKKATSTLDFLRRNIRHCPINSKRTAYIAVVRSVLEYGSIVGDPYHRLERIQHRAARFILGDYRLRHEGCVSTVLTNLGLHSPTARPAPQILVQNSRWLCAGHTS